MTARVISVVSWIVLSMAAVLMMVASYWLVWPDNVMVITSGPVTATDKKQYFPGQEVRYSFSYHKTRPIVGRISRALVDGTRTSFVTIQSDLPAGSHRVDVCEIRIPRNASPGVYHIDISGEYEINPLRTLVVRLRTNDFEIIENPNGQINQTQNDMSQQQNDSDRNSRQIEKWKEQMR